MAKFCFLAINYVCKQELKSQRADEMENETSVLSLPCSFISLAIDQGLAKCILLLRMQS